MTGLAAIPTRLSGPYISTSRAYCLANVESNSSSLQHSQTRRTSSSSASAAARGSSSIARVLLSILAFLAFDKPTLLSSALVFHFWNACTSPILHRHVTGAWDWCQNLLLARLESEPHLFAHIRSIAITFPSLANIERDRSAIGSQTDAYRVVWAAAVAALPPDQRVVALESYYDNEGQEYRELSGKADTLLYRWWYDQARETGRGDWVDGDRDPWSTKQDGPGRREGAAATVIASDSMSPAGEAPTRRLRFGAYAIEEVDKLLRPVRTLDSQRAHAQRGRPTRPASDPLEDPKSRHPIYRQLREPSLSVEGGQLGEHIAAILSLTPRLETLAVLRPAESIDDEDPRNTPVLSLHLPSTLLSIFFSSTTLLHLDIPATLHTFLPSLPPSLISLKCHSLFEHSSFENETTLAITSKSDGRLPALTDASFLPDHWAHWGQIDGTRARELVEEAAGVGLRVYLPYLDVEEPLDEVDSEQE